MTSDMEFSGRHALVTGGSRGIGRAIAAALKRRGATVTILGRDEVTMRAVVAAGEADACAVADVTDTTAVDAAVRQATQRAPIDIVVANAGAAQSAPFGQTTAAMLRAMLDVNLMGVIHIAQAVAPAMIARGEGRIIAVASTAGLKGYPYVTAYCAAKHAVIGYVRALAAETARTGLTVNAVCPGFTETDLVEESIATIIQKTGRPREAALASLTKRNPQGRLVQPDEVADAVLWLAGRGASAITGQAIAVAGGEV
ncbi:SDR family NAD(P)-dependent oxidoreductase [Beijerinckia sp. L45]|uniref:SDR family NAD(P)-dependent oxidoreductase n=1 Tax=Beijerinckia sp. L45 TaxID=1641855 RepID=UPI001FEFF6DB|nr:SDR family NAD(P)-dependent oxidoreductase [Beijerinckia sp. L45]